MRVNLTKKLYPLRSNRNAIHSLYSHFNIKEIRTRYISYPTSPKTKKVHLKILSNVYPSSEFLRRRFGFDHNNCISCDNDMETTEHLFFECIYAAMFWSELHVWLSAKIQGLCHFKKEHIIFGINMEELDKTRDINHVLNVLLLLAKFHIHTSKYTPPPISPFCFLYSSCFISVLVPCSDNSLKGM